MAEAAVKETADLCPKRFEGYCPSCGWKGVLWIAYVSFSREGKPSPPDEYQWDYMIKKVTQGLWLSHLGNYQECGASSIQIRFS